MAPLLSSIQTMDTEPMPSAAGNDAASPPVKRPREDDAAEDAKRPRADDAPAPAADAAAQDAATRQNLEARYLGLTFIDSDAESEGARTIVRVEKGGEWMAVAARVDNAEDEQPYLVNAALDIMVDAHRCRNDPRAATCACPPPPGHTIEVLWEVHDQETQESQDVWWRARVGEEQSDGHALDDGDVILRKFAVEYVGRPELSEPEPAAYDVCFLSPRALLDCAGDVVMQWRSFGSSDQPDPALVKASLDADAENALPIAQPREPAGNVDESVDVVVARVVGDHSQRLRGLPADQQCAVADRVVAAKERLKGALKAHLLARPDPAAPVTPEDVHAAVRSMAAAPPSDEGSLSDEESVRSEQGGY